MAISNSTEDAGAMLAVKAPEQQVAEVIKDIPGVLVANVNSNKQVVLGGSTEALKSAEEHLISQGFSVAPLSVAAAFHTDFVKHAQVPFSNFVRQQHFKAAQIPVYSNTTGMEYPSDLNDLKSILKNQMLNPVLFKKQIENIYDAGGRIFVEFGPKGILTSLVGDILEGKEHHAIAINASANKDSDLLFRQAVVQMLVLGLPLSNIDPYKKELAVLPPASGLTLQLSGNNFVSAATQKTHKDLMNDGFKISGGETKVIEKIVKVEKIVEEPTQSGVHQQAQNGEDIKSKEVYQLLQSTLDSFKNNQIKSIEIFERYLKELSQQSQQLVNVLTQQLTNGIESTVKTPSVSKALVNKFKDPSSSANGNGVHVESSANGFDALATATLSTTTLPGLDSNELTFLLLKVISEKTGYPVETLELDLDFEADLGIDTSERAELFNALAKQFPAISSINQQELAALRTLAELINYIGTNSSSSNGHVHAPEVAPADPTVATAPTPPVSTTKSTNDSAVGIENLTTSLLQVVSDKTGYPAEMLELSMDMEADLGIDSIKRVEIFGALTKMHPEMSGINPAELAELRTLQEIIGYVSGISGGDTPPTSPTAAETVAIVNSTNLPVPQDIAVNGNGTHDSSGDAGRNVAKLTDSLLQVVSDKTGYPAEMLELSMDMEADLGIDSIKRVEIFGALTKMHPEMSGINPAELAELRTLQEIIEYVSGISGGDTPPTSPAAAETVATVSVPISATNLPVSQDIAVNGNGGLAPSGNGFTKSPIKAIVKTTAFHGVKRFAVGLKYLPQPDLLEFSIPDTHVVVVTNDGSALTPKVITALQEKGNKVVTLNVCGINNPISDQAVTLAGSSDQEVALAIQEIRNTFGKIGGFIHLHPHYEFQGADFTEHFPVEKEVLKTLFFISKHVQSDLNELGKRQRAGFLACTRMDGKLGQGKRGNTSVVGGGITGLVKSLSLEWSPVFCRAIDVQPELSTDQMVTQLMAEYHDANVSLVEVAFSEEGRKTTAAIPTRTLENHEIKTTITPETVFLVSGGARGVTGSCVIEMAKTFGCKFILVGRSAIDFQIPAYAKKEHDEGALKRLIMHDMIAKGEQPSLPEVKSIFKAIIAKKEIDQTISKLQHHGSQVSYIQGDVTDLSSFKTALDQTTAQLGNVTGIIHGAGRLADKYIHDKAESDYEHVLSVKVDGMLSLLEAVNMHDVEHLILFSSVAGFYGNIGQTDYAVANEILSKAAHLFKTNHPKTKVSAINWGAWDSGMVSGELKTQLEAAGVSLVNNAGGAAMFINEMNMDYSDQAQVIIGGTLPEAVSHLGALKKYQIRRQLKLENNPFLNHHRIQNYPVLPIVNAAGWLVQGCKNLYPDYTVFKIENAVVFKGIVFDGNQKESYILSLDELEKDNEKIVFEAVISSEGKKFPVNHYRAKITLINKRSVPVPPQFDHQVSGTYQPTDGSVLYRDGSLFHGPYFQGIKEILDYTDQHLVLSCVAPEVPLSEQGQFPINGVNTFFADIQYQGMVVWVQKNRGGVKCLPQQTDCAIFYQPIPFGAKLIVNMSVQEVDEINIVAECTVYDEQGNVYCKTHGATATISNHLVW
jgi:polyketide-type polyunsaturated fatty acid synthase PfaA